MRARLGMTVVMRGTLGLAVSSSGGQHDTMLAQLVPQSHFDLDCSATRLSELGDATIFSLVKYTSISFFPPEPPLAGDWQGRKLEEI